MKKSIFFLIIIAIFSCKNLKELSSKIQSFDTSLNNINSINTDLLNDNELNKLDSLNLIFNNSDKVLVPNENSNLVDYLISLKSGDTIVLSNLSVQTLNKGQTSSYEYPLLKNDIISFRFLNDGSNKIEQISILEGDQIRFAKSNLKRRKLVSGSFKVLDHNNIVINITNNGFFKSNLKIDLKKIVKKYKTVVIKDSIIGTEIINQKKTDTLFLLDKDQNFLLKPYIDITSTKDISLPISFDENENILGWGYWFSLYPEDLLKYKNILDESGKDPLTSFAISEFEKDGTEIFLPITKNPYVETSLNFKGELNSSNRSEKNFDFFIRDSTNFMNGFLKFKNYSKLYEFKINFKLLKVVSKTGIIEKEVNVLNDFIKIEKF